MKHSDWSASISPEEMAIKMCDDLFYKFGQLEAMSEDRINETLTGLIDGLRDISFPHPEENVPDYLRSMDPNYCAGYSVGKTWRRIAKEWPSYGDK